MGTMTLHMKGEVLDFIVFCCFVLFLLPQNVTSKTEMRHDGEKKMKKKNVVD